eukprot:TRINITY_DN78997_c0_g1_i1.p1 TRINITY_DN78997_c0_g1~~TRINITY_DN78997_c0_g1_i1.p1  ORF type:complete len:325 (-),score=8.85 TRINITY_DN78997_c0_g1_i1:113-1000(-)
MEVAGRVVAVGAGVTRLKAGDDVFGITPISCMGRFAHYAVLHESAAAIRPPNVPPAVAAGLAAAGLTALQALRDGGGLPLPRAASEVATGAAVATGGTNEESSLAFATQQHHHQHQQRVLVANASGGVGHLAVQLAKLTGAHVTVTVGARNVSFAQSPGADEVLDYRTEAGRRLSASESVPAGGLYDVIVDGTGGGLDVAAVDAVLTAHGRWVHLTPPLSFLLQSWWRRVTLNGKALAPVFMRRSAGDLEVLAQLVARGEVRLAVDAVVLFDEARALWARSKEGHAVGKLVLQVE